MSDLYFTTDLFSQFGSSASADGGGWFGGNPSSIRTDRLSAFPARSNVGTTDDNHRARRLRTPGIRPDSN
ncbi:hypothetical protein ACFFYR_37395 [Paraburkholderia dipogonis]|uniref:hypothetical protein n=1 Tax=Paraburkholderia dipogonis TaxID=1211383 RepID=UPI0035ED8EA0